MILILTDKNDSHANHLQGKLIAQGLPHYKFCLDVESLKHTYVTYKFNSWKIVQNAIELVLDQVTCVWHRRTFVELLLDEEFDQTADFRIWKNEWNKTLLGIYSSLRTKPWLNYWRNSYVAENKYLQIEVACGQGFKVPKTIVSNDKVILAEFVAENEEVVLKLMHQDFYKSADGAYKGFYVNQVGMGDINKFNIKDENPIVLQEYVTKQFEVRYTVVGKSHFVCKIDSQKSKIANIDWRRYDIANTPHSIIHPPDRIQQSVNGLMAELGLEYGALDFIVNESDEWFFLEINSMGQYLWIEDLTGLKISDEIINWFENKLS